MFGPMIPVRLRSNRQSDAGVARSRARADSAGSRLDEMLTVLQEIIMPPRTSAPFDGGSSHQIGSAQRGRIALAALNLSGGIVWIVFNPGSLDGVQHSGQPCMGGVS
jgi:hypothetical protein